MSKCVYCRKEFQREDLRPYAENGGLTCYSCAMKPENREETERQCGIAFENAGPGAIITDEGIRNINEMEVHTEEKGDVVTFSLRKMN